MRIAEERRAAWYMSQIDRLAQFDVPVLSNRHQNWVHWVAWCRSQSLHPIQAMPGDFTEWFRDTDKPTVPVARLNALL